MNQQLVFETTNYLTPYMFYNKFLFWVVRLESFVSQNRKPPMTANEFVLAFRILYGSGLRVSELTESTVGDFNLNHRILKIAKAKTGYNQLATILPYDIYPLEKHFATKSKKDKAFPVGRHLLWDYSKDAGRLAGLNIGEVQKQKVVDGMWTHLFRKSCSKRMKALGASRELRMAKLRHVFKDAHDAYDNEDIQAVLGWEWGQWGSRQNMTREMLN